MVIFTLSGQADSGHSASLALDSSSDCLVQRSGASHAHLKIDSFSGKKIRFWTRATFNSILQVANGGVRIAEFWEMAVAGGCY